MWWMDVLPPSNIAWSFLCCKLCVMSTINASIHACVFYPRQAESVLSNQVVSFSFHLYFYTFLSIHPSVLCPLLSLYTCLCMCLSPLHPASVTVWFSNLSILIHFLFISLISPLFRPVYIPASPSSSLSFSLKSVTYLQHSCLMNNGGETVTISVSISSIPPLICAPLPSCLSSQVSPHLLSPFNFSLVFISLDSKSIFTNSTATEKGDFGLTGQLWNTIF